MTSPILFQTGGGRPITFDGSSVGLRSGGLVGVMDAGVSMAMIAQSGATSGQVIAWNGTAWAPATSSGGGLTHPQIMARGVIGGPF